ncbi:13468_t:CDS:2 [Funneliformis geosporum]|nr:13468_t:CDS:2 [Funneliformis geosporum]
MAEGNVKGYKKAILKLARLNRGYYIIACTSQRIGCCKSYSNFEYKELYTNEPKSTS